MNRGILAKCTKILLKSLKDFGSTFLVIRGRDSAIGELKEKEAAAFI
jgi:hypothetical protein